MPTVLMFSWFYLPDLGGSELFTDAITRRLCHRYRFVIVTARVEKDRARREERTEATVLRVGRGGGIDKLLYPLPALRAALSVTPVDLVHPIMVNAAALSAWVYLRLRHRPSLLTLQSGDSVDYVKHYMGPAYPLFGLLHRPFDRVHAISSHLRERAIQFGAAPESVTVVPNGVELDHYGPGRFETEKLDELRARLGIVGRRVIVSVSRLVVKNGIDTLIRALPAVIEKHPDVVLMLVGDGEDRTMLESLATSVGVREQTLFLGAVDPRDTPTYLAVSDVFARPSVSEGLGTAFLEAMASGLPVVATRAGGIPDFLVDGDNGLFCEVGQPESVARSLNALLGDATLRQRLGGSGRALVTRDFGWDTVAGRIGDVYEDLLSESRRD